MNYTDVVVEFVTREEWINSVRAKNGLPPVFFDDLEYQETIDIDYEEVKEDESEAKGEVRKVDQSPRVQREELSDQRAEDIEASTTWEEADSDQE